MKLTLARRWPNAECTIGALDINGLLECYILEDIERPSKLAGRSAIPRGTYTIAITFSNRFQRRLPLLLDVPDFSGIRIHPGNVAADTAGCLLPGVDRYATAVGHSLIAFDRLFGKLLSANDAGELITIEITG